MKHGFDVFEDWKAFGSHVASRRNEMSRTSQRLRANLFVLASARAGEKRFQQTDVRFVCGKSWGELASPYPHTKSPFPWAIGSRFGSRTRKYVRCAHKSS